MFNMGNWLNVDSTLLLMYVCKMQVYYSSPLIFHTAGLCINEEVEKSFVRRTIWNFNVHCPKFVKSVQWRVSLLGCGGYVLQFRGILLIVQFSLRRFFVGFLFSRLLGGCLLADCVVVLLSLLGCSWTKSRQSGPLIVNTGALEMGTLSLVCCTRQKNKSTSSKLYR